MNTNKALLIVFILVLIAGNVILGVRYFSWSREISQVKASLETYKTNEKVLNFAELFITKVLKAEGEVDFDTRLKLENAVRDLEDEQILAKWQKFTDSESEADAQTAVKDLLELLVKKVNVK